MLRNAIILASILLSSSALANYQAATRAFQQRNYVAAAGAFFQVYAYPRNKTEKRAAEWFLAESLRGVGLFYSSSQYYSFIVRRGFRKDNPYFRKAMERLGEINRTVSLGQSHIVQLFKAKVDPSAVPGPARGFYFYYLGVDRYSKQEFQNAAQYFSKVPAGSAYYRGSLFHLGVIANARGRHSQAVNYFQKVRNSTGKDGVHSEIWELANLNLARVHYETKKYRLACS